MLKDHSIWRHEQSMMMEVDKKKLEDALHHLNRWCSASLNPVITPASCKCGSLFHADYMHKPDKRLHYKSTCNSETLISIEERR
jgi:predicted Zn-ribbon and HTH transcriptional regulator